jgi:hypothetical protein
MRDNINLDLEKMGFGGMDRIMLTRDRDRRLAIYWGNKPSGSKKHGEYLN